MEDEHSSAELATLTEQHPFIWLLATFNLLLCALVVLRILRVHRKLTTAPASHAVSKDERALERLRQLWAEARLAFAPDIEADPYLSPPPEKLDALLRRYLKAEAGDADAAARRLRATAEWRRVYKCVDLHQPNMARRLFMHGTNPGATMYFGDYGLRDRTGEPVLVGRNLHCGRRKPSDLMVPCTHLRAALLVVERVACECERGASYILDVSDPTTCADMAGVLAGTRYWDADGAVDEHASIAEGRAPSPSVGPHAAHHYELKPGMPTLKEALGLMTAHYPELLFRVYFYRPAPIFQFTFAIFSRWLPASTRAKLVLVRQGDEHRHFLSAAAPGGGLDAAALPIELGGRGPSLGGDDFLARAVARYDAVAAAQRGRKRYRR